MVAPTEPRLQVAADRPLRGLGATGNRALLYEWELKPGVWHLHFVVGMETAIERRGR